MNCSCDSLDLFNRGCQCGASKKASSTNPYIEYISDQWLSAGIRICFHCVGNGETVNVSFKRRDNNELLKLSNPSRWILTDSDTKLSGVIANKTPVYIHVIVPPSVPIEGYIC